MITNAGFITRIIAVILSFFSLVSSLSGIITNKPSPEPVPEVPKRAYESTYIVRPLTDITFNGVSIKDGFAIVTPDTEAGTLYGDAALALQDGICDVSGIELGLINKSNSPAFVISDSLNSDAPNEFSLTVNAYKITVTGGSDIGIARGIRAFADEVLYKAAGVYDFVSGYEYKKTFSDFTTYEAFGAAGDGVSDDLAAIVKTHTYANENGLSVLAKEGAVYYIGSGSDTAVIKTDTDWSTARFIIDDTAVVSRSSNIFSVPPTKPAVTLTGAVTSIRRDSSNLGFSLESDSVVILADSNVKRYIRYGLNQDSGNTQTDVVLADKDGNISPSTPLIWDFDDVTFIRAYPIDSTVLTASGGIFTTIANRAPSEYTYYNRGISVTRSNVTVDNVTHTVTGEGDTGAPYSGFLTVQNCAGVTVKNCTLSGHKTYRTIGSAGSGVPMGTYDINAGTAMNITFLNCNQINDINDTSLWGIFGSNYCKNLVYDGCAFSRFDAHMGVANATIRNCVLGHHGINLIGFGTALIENTCVKSANFINLRSDYGSTWNGELIIRGCKYIPTGVGAYIIAGSNPGDHDFGYTCYLPRNIVIDGLEIDKAGKAYLFSDMNSNCNSASYVAQYPMVLPEKITVSGMNKNKLAVSQNKYMFAGVTVEFTD